MGPSGTAGSRLPLFVYGTLRDDAVLAAVLGCAPASLAPRDAWLADHRCVCVPGRRYPRVQRCVGEAVQGRLLHGLEPAHWRRLARFEGAEYRFRRTRVHCGERVVTAWYCDHVGSGGGAPWRFESWRRRYRRAFVRAARRAMAAHRD